MAYNFSPLKQKMKDIEEWLKKEFTTIRTGRANPAILDAVTVESYGSMLPVNQVGNISGEDARSLRITPYDMSQAKHIEKAIVAANLGISVVLDDKGVRVIFPELTTDRRGAFVKVAKEKLEGAKINLRKERDKTWDDIQKKEKEGGMGEDEKFRLKKEMEKTIEDAGKKLEEMFAKKEKEILS